MVEELSVSPLVVSKISEGHIDESWVKVLAEVDRRAVAYKKSSSQAQSKAMADLGPLLEKLVQKVGVAHHVLSGRMLTTSRPWRGFGIS